jgi:hypothetical protein
MKSLTKIITSAGQGLSTHRAHKPTWSKSIWKTWHLKKSQKFDDNIRRPCYWNGGTLHLKLTISVYINTSQLLSLALPISLLSLSLSRSLVSLNYPYLSHSLLSSLSLLLAFSLALSLSHPLLTNYLSLSISSLSLPHNISLSLPSLSLFSFSTSLLSLLSLCSLSSLSPSPLSLSLRRPCYWNTGTFHLNQTISVYILTITTLHNHSLSLHLFSPLSLSRSLSLSHPLSH